MKTTSCFVKCVRFVANDEIKERLAGEVVLHDSLQADYVGDEINSFWYGLAGKGLLATKSVVSALKILLSSRLSADVNQVQPKTQQHFCGDEKHRWLWEPPDWWTLPSGRQGRRAEVNCMDCTNPILWVCWNIWVHLKVYSNFVWVIKYYYEDGIKTIHSSLSLAFFDRFLSYNSDTSFS